MNFPFSRTPLGGSTLDGKGHIFPNGSCGPVQADVRFVLSFFAGFCWAGDDHLTPQAPPKTSLEVQALAASKRPPTKTRIALGALGLELHERGAGERRSWGDRRPKFRAENWKDYEGISDPREKENGT